jgi:DNA-binding response OmpR family regulator
MMARWLAGTGHRPIVANDVRHATRLLQRERPDAVVLDLAMPGDCESVVQWLRRDPARAGIAVVRVTARARHAMPTAETGIDVNLPKPFTPRQIAVGVRTAVLRRAARARLAATYM